MYVTVLGTAERNSLVSLEARTEFSFDIWTLEDEGTVFSPNVGNWLPSDMAYLWRMESLRLLLLGISYGLAGSTKYMHVVVSIEKLYSGLGS